MSRRSRGCLEARRSAWTAGGRGLRFRCGIDDDALGDLLDEIGIGLELNSAGPAIEPLLAALIGAAPPAALHAAAIGAVEALWDAELEHEIRTELEGFRSEVVGEDSGLVSRIDCALRGLVEPSADNQVAHVLVWRAATKLLAGRTATTSEWTSSSEPLNAPREPSIGV